MNLRIGGFATLLQVFDMPTSLAFYRDVLGLAVVRRDDGRSVWLDAGGTILMLETRGEHEPATNPASRELTCFAIEPDRLQALARRLEAAGLTIEGRTPFTVYFRDPDGRRVGLSSYPVPLPGVPE